MPGKVQASVSHVKRGEIFGIAGLVGAGRTELLRAIVGMEPGSSGKLRIKGKTIGWPPDPRRRASLASRSRPRIASGKVWFSACRLTPMSHCPIPGRARKPASSRRADEMKRARPVTERLGLQKGALKRDARTLSGGNQQKLVLAKWLEMKMAVLLVDEPTRGVDIGAKVELFAVLEGLARSGVAVVMVSSELEEVMDHSDRVLGPVAGPAHRRSRGADNKQG